MWPTNFTMLPLLGQRGKGGSPDPVTLTPATMDDTSPRRIGVLHSQAKEIIYYVNKYFLHEKANRGPILDPSQALARTAKATNVSVATVKRICSKLNKKNDTVENAENPTFTSWGNLLKKNALGLLPLWWCGKKVDNCLQ